MSAAFPLKHRMSRRTAISGLAGMVAWSWRSHREALAAPAPEVQRGDIDLPYESLSVDRSFVESLTGPSRAQFEARADDFPGLVSKTAEEFVGRSRQNNADFIGDMLALFELPFQDRSGKYVPFCASGLAYVVARAYVTHWKKQPINLSSLRGALAEIDHYHFFPSPSVWHMFAVAQAKGRWLPQAKGVTPRPGWVAIYDFGKSADHVGLVLSADSDGFRAFECNTSGRVAGSQQNGGVIAIKNRTWKYVKGYIRTDKQSIV